MIVLDTNVVSEIIQSEPSPAVLTWLARQGRLHTTAVTVAELRYGVDRLPDGRRRATLNAAVERAVREFPDEPLVFDLDAARQYGRIMADRERSGRPMSVLDGQIAAICLARGAALATRNVKDFEGAGIDVVDPWSG